ncbi:Nuclear GTPase SLIP-GC [Colletotrichum tanaceti]|uniref:Nuclear GTPase SLIP-GC n=1 Tax=Colletotrichum tanaceti TaxID=1306861 RepID=A0A4U6X8X4_9PEZI|nr:Nuclear GTPase SLIP-GC [Colletotrichum tanaceti]
MFRITDNLRLTKREPDDEAQPAPDDEDSTAATPPSHKAFSYRHKMRHMKDPETWEQFTRQVLPILDRLEPDCERIVASRKLQPAVRTAASHWLQQIRDLRARAERSTQTIVGVLGNTGDGKSSIINALLDEENLLPTNCMRACTAVATELSYNHDEDNENPYRMEVEFISRQEWSCEVNVLLSDLVANGGMNMDDMDPNSDAARALAKILAVYPSLDTQTLTESSSAQLVEHPNVRELLGTTKTMKAPSASEIREQITPYVDSKDKDDETAAHWPLVKVVRIFTKARVLSNGVTIVDLPGHQDWDAARAAVASQYMKACSGIWIVAPINRAVDNKTAKDLMSNSIRRQLKLDGAYSALTIICSKTDDITINSAMESLKGKLCKETMQAWEDALACDRRIKALEKELMALRQRRGVTQAPDSAGSRVRRAKRARTEAPSKSRATAALLEPADEDAGTEPRTSNFDEKQQELYDCKLEKKDLMDQVHAQCIQRRNELSRQAVKRHLAKSFQDLDRQDGQGYETQSDGEPRDYEDMSRQTPVFCTSSHVYQQMRGLLMTDNDLTPGFETEDDTEIPQLQDHAQKLTEELRVAKQREVLSGICQILNSIAIWAQDASKSTVTIDSETLTTLLQMFEANLKADGQSCIDRLDTEAQTKLYDELTRLTSAATSQAGIIAERWRSISWNTFKATCLRGGVFKDNDLNEQLLEPIKSGISATWSNFFQFNVASVLDGFSVAATEKLIAFHEGIVARLGDHDFSELQASVQLDQQLMLHKERILRLAAQSRADIDQAQKDASRAFNPAVARAMKPGYQRCTVESGKSSSFHPLRIHIRRNKFKMFRHAARDVKHIIGQGMKLVDDNMTEQVKTIAATMTNDYMLALAERQEYARHHEAKFKKDVMEVLETAAKHFK